MRPLALTLAAPLTALAARAQQPGTPTGTPRGLPPAHPLGAVEARAPEPFASLANVRELSGRRVLVNDPERKRILLFDSTLATYTVVADTTRATGNAYGGRFGGLIPYRGDSTLYVDPGALTMLVIDPAGKLVRTMAVPRSNDAAEIGGSVFGVPGFDARGRLVYRGHPTVRTSSTPEGVQVPVFSDSLPLVRVDLATRKLDTAGFFKIAPLKFTVAHDANGHPFASQLTDPLPVVDDWAVLNDGTIVILRGQDFHADFVGADGRLRSAPRVPHEWQRMRDEDKVAYLDSTKAATEKRRAEFQARLAAGTATGAARGAASSAASGSAPAGGGGGVPITVMISTSRDDGPPARNGEPPPRGGAPAVTVSVPAINFVPAGELPDYKPPFARGGARADLDGRVWVRLIATRPMPGPVYDVIDGQGRLVDRVVLPPNSAVAGFGPGGVVYLGVRDSAGVHLLRARVR